MKRNLYYLLIFMLPAVVRAQSKVSMSEGKGGILTWITQHFEKNKIPPFSFVYNNNASATFISKWNKIVIRENNIKEGVVHYTYRYSEPGNGLEVICEVKGYPEFNAVEWMLRFANKGSIRSKIIEQVKVTDLQWTQTQATIPIVHYADGSYASKEDFHPRLKVMEPGAHLRMVPEGGRSSQKRFPFFNISFTEQRGVMVAIGWTGTWFADVMQKDRQQLYLATGMEHLRTYLDASETIRTPSTALVFWSGTNRFEGHNKFRKFILAHHTQKVAGKIAPYPISNSFNYGDPAPCNEYSCMTSDYGIAMVKRYRQFNLVSEAFWLDAGWYKGAANAPAKNWANTVGNWQVDSMRFPNGLADIADEVHKAGSKFMVWFEPERVMKNSDWARLHPEWMLNAHDTHDAFLFNLGNKEARQWMCKEIGKIIADNKIDYYRQDFNMEIDLFWKNNDAADRTGITEIKYIEGLYAFWDYLLERFPGLIIDNCASGGRRIDLESTSRSIPLWRTDYNYGEPVGYQCHTYGLNLYLPLHGTGTHKTDKFTFRSSLGTSIVYNWKVTEGEFSITEMQARQAEFKKLRPYFYEDYYPLTSTAETTSDSIWLAYQLHRESDNSGYVIAFRRALASADSCKVQLKGLAQKQLYSIVNEDTGEEIKKRGSELESGLMLELKDPTSSLLLKYCADNMR